MANKDLGQNQVNITNQYKTQDFDKYLSDFICKAFDIITKTGNSNALDIDKLNFDNFNFQGTLNKINTYRQIILDSARQVDYIPYLENLDDQDSQYGSCAKYKPASQKSKLTWLKFILATIFVVGFIVAIVFESYILAVGSAFAAILSWLAPEFCKSCCKRKRLYITEQSHEDKPSSSCKANSYVPTLQFNNTDHVLQ